VKAELLRDMAGEDAGGTDEQQASERQDFPEAQASPAQPLDTLDLLRRIADSLRAEFTAFRAIPHHGETGRAIEDALRRTLERHLPARVGLRSGFALGTDRRASQQADLLLVDALACPAFLQAESMGIYPIEGVVGAIEVTSSLVKEKWLKDCDKLTKFKQLPPSTFLQTSALPPLGMIFAAGSSCSLQTVGEWVASRFNETAADDRRYLPNCVVVLEKGLVCYIGVDQGQKHLYLSFSPVGAKQVAVIDSPQFHLGVFLHLLLQELHDVFASRLEGYLMHLIREAKNRPLHRGGLLGLENETIDVAVVVALQLAGAAAFFPEYASYLGDDLEERLAGSLHCIPVGP
jgi:hypothetical protein